MSLLTERPSDTPKNQSYLLELNGSAHLGLRGLGHDELGCQHDDRL